MDKKKEEWNSLVKNETGEKKLFHPYLLLTSKISGANYY